MLSHLEFINRRRGFISQRSIYLVYRISSIRLILSVEFVCVCRLRRIFLLATRSHKSTTVGKPELMFTTCFVAYQSCRRTTGRLIQQLNHLQVIITVTQPQHEGESSWTHCYVLELMIKADKVYRGQGFQGCKFQFDALFLLEVTHTKMEECRMSIGTLREDVLTKLSKMLDNSTCGWRQLAIAVSENSKFRCR